MPAHAVGHVIAASVPPGEVSVPCTVIWIPSTAWIVAPGAIVTVTFGAIVMGVLSYVPSVHVWLLVMVGLAPPAAAAVEGEPD